MKENWKPVKGFEVIYLISDKGRVKNIALGKKRTYGRILSETRLIKGYCSVTLCDNWKQKSFPVHRLVAIAFLEKPEGKDFVNHLNGNKHDNQVSNLQWCTHSENILHSYQIRPRVLRPFACK